MLKYSLLLSLFVSAAFSQVPAHSVVNGITVDLADIDVPVPYGTVESKAVVAVCSAQPATRIQLQVISQALDGIVTSTANYESQLVKTPNGYCASIISPQPRSKVTQVNASAFNDANLFSALPGPTGAQAEKTQTRK